MTELPETYDPDSIESKWRERWQQLDVYSYDGSGDTEYVIDTPPPYPTGNLHIGNALGWCYMDFAARYHRLQGADVLFPQGWDCHGLPTEVKVEENHGIHRTELSREEFRELCIEHTEQQIAAMRETMERLGFSQDWDHEYRTMDPEYWGKTQRSIVRMAENGYVYRDEHPVNWCPRCMTAIADAEVETEEGVPTTLYRITFLGVDGEDDATGGDSAGSEPIEIATTRPELLGACVAVAADPDDERYADRVGETFAVPLFGHEVELIADAEVDSEFGTGAVMICTFGDKQDVDWWADHDLPLRPIVAEDGTLTDAAGEYAGLDLDAAADAVVADLREAGHLAGEADTTGNVGQCWRCDTPIEILSTEQWFIEVREEEILDTAQAVDWIPEHMYERLADWTRGMDWDWVISRQREFATPIPAWHCAGDDCGYTYLAGEDELPVDPTETDPGIDACPDCGGREWRGETDVMDTWVDSSISPLVVQGWPGAFEPAALREQGHDIIRTWAFYTILRVAALEGDVPWEEALINGMVFGEDGNKMSKSRGNFVQPETVVEEHSADAFRQAMALGGQPGSDVQFQWTDVRSASRFLTKLWNVTRFAATHLAEDWEPPAAPAYRDTDRWLLSRCSRVADEVADEMDAYRFDAALRAIREFVWHDLADDYVELVKGRLYEGAPAERDAARAALFTTVSASLRMLAPFAPFVTEEAWHALPGTEGSVHGSAWPEPGMASREADAVGAIIADAASTVRGWKSEAGIALNEPLDRVEVYPEKSPGAPVDTYDLSEAVNAPVRVREGEPDVELVPVALEPDHATLGPEFRDRTEQVVAALESMDPADVDEQLRSRGELEVDLGGEVVVVPESAVEIREEHRSSSGERVTVLAGAHSTIIVTR